MKKVTRRMFLKAMLIGGGIATASALGVYVKAAGMSGLKSDFQLLEQVCTGYNTRPEDKILVDSHAHFTEPRKGFSIEAILPTFSEKTDLQSISAIIKGEKFDRLSYEMLQEMIKDYVPKQKRFSIEMSDPYATALRDHELDKHTTFIRSQEVMASNPESEGHEIHICLEGCSYLKDGADVRDVIEYGLKRDAFVMLNHPFAKPVSYLKFWFPKKKEKQFLAGLADNYNIIVEGHNMINSLWMAASNGAAVKYISDNSEREVPFVANTDAHMADLQTTKELIGLSGTLFNKEDLDVKGLTGKEIIQKKKGLMLSHKFETLENFASPLLFYRCMMNRKHW